MTPPIPTPATKRATLKTIGSFVNPAAAVNTLNSAMQIATTQRRPIRSARVPKRMLPNIMPNSAELTMKPALAALTPMLFMIDGRAMPATAKS